MKIELMEIQPDGSGFFIAHLDDGSSFNQQIHNAPVNDANALLLFCADKAEEALARQAPLKPIPSDITAMKRTKIDVPKRTKATDAEPGGKNKP